MSILLPSNKSSKEKIRIGMYIDLEKDKSHFYTNVYLSQENIVVKQSFSWRGAKESNIKGEIKIENFDLAKYIFLINY